MDPISLRTTLIITLSVLLGVILYRNLLRYFKKSIPMENQAWLADLKVAYHPQRVLVELQVPTQTRIVLSILDQDSKMLLAWTEESLGSGAITLERALGQLADGVYFFVVTTASQRTIRRFSILNS